MLFLWWTHDVFLMLFGLLYAWMIEPAWWKDFVMPEVLKYNAHISWVCCLSMFGSLGLYSRPPTCFEDSIDRSFLEISLRDFVKLFYFFCVNSSIFCTFCILLESLLHAWNSFFEVCWQLFMVSYWVVESVL